MSFREIIPFILAAVGGVGGLTNALAGMEIVDALNTNRPTDDQISNPPPGWNDFAWGFRKIRDSAIGVVGGDIANNFRKENWFRGKTQA